MESGGQVEDSEVRSGEGYIEAGSGPAIVMLPGMEGSEWFWRFQLEALCDRYRVVSCRLAVRRPSPATTIGDYSAEVLRVMDSIGIEDAIVVGESIGGMVTQHLALEHPERVRAVVLCNTMDNPRRWGFGLNVFTLATLMHQLAFLPFLTDRRRKRLLMWVGRHRGFVMDPSPGNADLCDYLMEHGLECGGAAYVDRFIAGGRSWFTSRLHEISVPALVLRGTEDRLVTPDAALSLAGRIPGAELALIEGGGHCCPHTMPGPTTSAIEDWLARKRL